MLRSVATTTVVLWHWVFTIIVWRGDGPHADNPIGYVSGLWSLTGLFLWHTVGDAAHCALHRIVREVPDDPGAELWLTQPLFLLGPLLLTVPLLAISRPRRRRA